MKLVSSSHQAEMCIETTRLLDTGKNFLFLFFFLTETIPKRCQLGVIYSAHKLTRPNIG